MKEMQVIVSDDIIFADTGKRVTADETVILSLDGKRVELDLCESNAKELRELLDPWLNAGHKPESTPASPPARKTLKGEGVLKAGRLRMAELRQWVDENHVRSLSPPDRPAYLTRTGKNYSPDWLLHAYANAMAERGEHDEWIDKWANK